MVGEILDETPPFQGLQGDPPMPEDPPSSADQAASEALNRLESPPQEAPRKRGRPPGSGTKSKPGRKPGQGSKASQNAPEDVSPEEKEASIQACAVLGKTIWDNLVAPATNRLPLADDQALALGAALDPVLEKYLPMLGDWRAETALVMTVLALFQATKKQPVDLGYAETS